MDLNHIFKLFIDPPKEELPKLSEDTQRLVDDFKDHPLVKIGMFRKIIKNYLVLGNTLLNFFEKSNVDLEVDDIKKAGEYMIYSRAWEYIKGININNKFHLEHIRIVSNQDFIEVLDNTIQYFKSIESYEKCAHLYSIKEKVKEFSK